MARKVEVIHLSHLGGVPGTSGPPGPKGDKGEPGYGSIVRGTDENRTVTAITSGTVTLATVPLTLAAGVVYDIEATGFAELRTTGGAAGTGQIGSIIAGTAQTSSVTLTFGADSTLPKMLLHDGRVTGTGAAVNVTLRWTRLTGAFESVWAKLRVVATPV